MVLLKVYMHDETQSTSFGRLLQEYRLRSGLTQEALAEVAGLGRRSVQGLERGENFPLRGTIQRLIQALALSPAEASQFAEAAGSARRRHRKGVDAEASPEPSPDARSEKTRRHNLPTQLTSFVGRERERAEVRVLLATTRLLTLTGSGGCGKTRLALQVATDLVESYPDGVWFVDLAPLADPTLVPQAVADALDVREVAGRPFLATLLAALCNRRLLLLLDNCEHLLDASAQLAATLLRTCPRLRLLATSRELLGVAGETAWPVPGLSRPDPRQPPTPASIAQYESVQLFLDRARAALPSFALTDPNAPAVAQICERLDGIPLAIELAAARVRVLTVEQITARLDDRFGLLTGGSRSASQREQTLRASIDWSYQLLSEPERTLLRRLAVFSGGWTLEAAEAMGVGESNATSDVLNLLSALVDKSLVMAESQGDHARYRLLETIRQYADQKLRDAGEATLARARHLAWFGALAERAAPHLWRIDAATWLGTLEIEHDNFRAALEWCRQGDAPAGLRLAASLRWFWVRRGYLAEGSRWLTTMLDLAPEHTPARAPALLGAGILARDQGKMVTATRLIQESLRLYREAGDQEGIAHTLTYLGLQSEATGDYRQARTLIEEGLAVGQDLVNEPIARFTLGYLGQLDQKEGDFAGARRRYEELLRLSREDGNPAGIVVALNYLGNLARAEGDYPRARVHLSDALTLRRTIGGGREIARALFPLGELAVAEGDYPRARALLEEALGIARQTGARESAGILASLGDVARLEGDYPKAVVLLRESLALLRFGGDRPGLCRSVRLLGLVAGEQGAPERALRLLAAATANAPRGALLESAEGRRYDAGVADARAALPEESYAQALAEGQAMTLEQAVAYALEEDDD